MKKLTLLLALLFSVTAGAADPRVYLLAKIRIDQTTYSQVVFFYNKEVTSKQMCERDVMSGQRGNWEYYRHIVNLVRGFSLNSGYQCLVTPLQFSTWNQYANYGIIYLIDMRKEEIKVTPQESYSSCLTTLRKQQPDEDARFYCAKSNQSIQET